MKKEEKVRIMEDVDKLQHARDNLSRVGREALKIELGARYGAMFGGKDVSKELGMFTQGLGPTFVFRVVEQPTELQSRKKEEIV